MDKLTLVPKHRPSAADHPPEGQRRFRLTIEYDGTAYCGWQRQINGPSVQETLEQALCTLTQERVSVTGSSRTDAGVHALGLCAHFDSATRIPAQKLAFALNTMLPPDIRVRESSLAPEGFHARYSACGKLYRYAFYNARHDCAIGRQYAAHIPLPMDERLMDEEAQALLGTHDFAAFAASGSVAKSTVRTIVGARVTREGERVTLCVMGDGFLYNMVRIIAGTLLRVGGGQMKPEEMKTVLEAKDRSLAGDTARPEGLTLMEIEYLDDKPRG